MKLLDQVVVVARQRRLAENTIDVYLLRIRQYLAFCAARRGGWTHPRELGTADVEAFLNHLVIERRLSASTQNQALNAVVFLYRRVLDSAAAAGRRDQAQVGMHRKNSYRLLI